MSACLDHSWLETSFPLRDEDKLARTTVDDGAVRHGDHRLIGRVLMKDHVRIHVGLQLTIRIREFYPHPCSARLRFQFGIDERHTPFHRLTGKGSEGNGRPVPGGNGTDIALRYLRNHPDCREVRDPVELIPGHDSLAADHLLFDNRAACRRWPLDRARYCATLPNFADARLGHTETAQLLGRAIDHRHLARVMHIARCLDSERVLKLRLYERRAVKTEERRPRLHRLPGCVDMQFLDVTFGSQRDDRLLSFVDADGSGGADGPYQGSQLHFFSADTAALHAVHAHLDGVVVAVIVVLIHGDVVHPHGVLLRSRGRVGQSHRVSVKANLAFAARGLRLFRPWTQSRLVVAIDRKVIAALATLLWLRRPHRPAP